MDELGRLFVAARGGDLAAFAAIVDRTAPIVRGIARRWRSYGIDDEEMATLVYVEAWRRLRSIRDATRFVPWLTRVTVRTVSREARRCREAAAACEGGEALLRVPAQPAVEDLAWIREMVEDLPEDCRVLVNMKYLREMTLEEIATFTGLRIHRIEYLLRKGKDLLRERIQRGEQA